MLAAEMFTEERHHVILDLLDKKQRLTVRDLQKKLRISSATLRRDLTELEASGRLVRVHGGAVHPQYLKGELKSEQQGHEALAAKRAIAAAAAELVEPHQTVFLDAGTTCLQLGRALAVRPDLTLVTNSPAFLQVAHESSARVVCVGGEVRRAGGALVGALALDWLEHLRADWAFIGAAGLDDTEGPSTFELAEAAVKQAMLRRAARAALLADSSKWDRPATTVFARWEQFAHFVCDDGIDPAAIRRITERGVRVHRTPIAPSR